MTQDLEVTERLVNQEYGNVPGMLRLDKTGLVRDYENYLVEEERSRNTITKYMHDLKSYFIFLQGEAVTKESLVCWKEKLTQTYLPASVNSMLAAVNGFLEWAGYPQYRVKPLKIQREIFYETGERAVKGGVHPSGKSSRGKAELPSCPYSADNLCHGHPYFGAAVYHAGNSQDRADCGGLQRKETYGFSARCIKPRSAGILPGAWNQRRRCVSHKKQKTS